MCDALGAEIIVTPYEPPLSELKAGGSWIAGETQLAPGVLGFAYEQDGEILIPLIIAEKKGYGDVGRFLDSLSSRCVITDVINKRLEAMLERRGFKRELGGCNWRRR